MTAFISIICCICLKAKNVLTREHSQLLKQVLILFLLVIMMLFFFSQNNMRYFHIRFFWSAKYITINYTKYAKSIRHLIRHFSLSIDCLIISNFLILFFFSFSLECRLCKDKSADLSLILYVIFDVFCNALCFCQYFKKRVVASL